MHGILLFDCANCHETSVAICPECVNTIAIDPTTGIPPDVAIVDGKAVSIKATSEALARSRKEPVCDNCINRRNEMRPGEMKILTSEERHKQFHL